MGRDYRRELRERGIEPGRVGRPPLPDPLNCLRDGWRRATAAQRAEFMAEAGLCDAGRETDADRLVEIEGK